MRLTDHIFTASLRRRFLPRGPVDGIDPTIGGDAAWSCCFATIQLEPQGWSMSKGAHGVEQGALAFLCYHEGGSNAGDNGG